MKKYYDQRASTQVQLISSLMQAIPVNLLLLNLLSSGAPPIGGNPTCQTKEHGCKVSATNNEDPEQSSVSSKQSKAFQTPKSNVIIYLVLSPISFTTGPLQLRGQDNGLELFQPQTKCQYWVKINFVVRSPWRRNAIQWFSIEFENPPRSKWTRHQICKQARCYRKIDRRGFAVGEHKKRNGSRYVFVDEHRHGTNLSSQTHPINLRNDSINNLVSEWSKYNRLVSNSKLLTVRVSPKL